MGTQTVVQADFNELQFEKQLASLKDSQEAINTCCKWCLEHRVHHKKIVNCWLNVLKRVKVEQRLILFYLANDVVQYSKRRNYEYVASWGTAIQKATTMVRDEKVKHKILRIFKIWEQRNVYNEEFIADLCGLLSITPAGSKTDEPHEFQPNYVVNKIKNCSKLEKDTDAKLKLLKEHNPKIQFDDNLIGALKDRAHVDDVEKEVDDYIKHMEDYINALKAEIKNRIALISVLKQAETQLEADRKDVKVVANAYRMFGTRVKTFQKKLEEHKATLSSPIPSPDINAPSPNSDSDIDLPEEDQNAIVNQPKEESNNATYNPKAELQIAAGYYNSALPSTEKDNSFLSNGFSSFIGSDVAFNIDNLNSTVFSNTQSIQKSGNFTPPPVPVAPLPVQAPVPISVESNSYSYSTNSYSTSHTPLQPPPMPPFTKNEMDFPSASSFDMVFTSNSSANNQYDESFNTTSVYNSTISSYSTTDTSRVQNLFQDESFEPPAGANPYPPTENPYPPTEEYKPEDYNPEEATDAWDPTDQQHGWSNVEPISNTDTPESPPMFEKEGYSDPVEYHDNVVQSGVEDVDQRVVPGTDMDDSLGSLGVKDVDHRNLISLTGSPGNSNSTNSRTDSGWVQADQDYRLPPPLTSVSGDRDYRMSFNIEQLKLPPPPPPPPKQQMVSRSDAKKEIPLESPTKLVDNSTLVTLTKSPRISDNIESIDMDMDLSDDDFEGRLNTSHENLKLIVDGSKEDPPFSLEPPPPLPDLPDDVDANNLLDDLTSDLHEFSNLSDELNNCGNSENSVADNSNVWNQTLLPPPGLSINFREILEGPPPAPPHPHGVPLPIMNVQSMIPPSMGAPPPPPPIPPPNHDLMSPPPMPILPPPMHSNWTSKEADMMSSHMPSNEGSGMPWMGDKDQWSNEDEYWENDDGRAGDEENLNYMMDSEQDPMPMQKNLNYMMNSEQDPMPMQNNWMSPNMYNSNSNHPPFRGGRGNNRGPNNFKRGRGRGGNYNNRGGNFRGGRGGFSRGGNRGNTWRGGNFRGNFARGGF